MFLHIMAGYVLTNAGVKHIRGVSFLLVLRMVTVAELQVPLSRLLQQFWWVKRMLLLDLTLRNQWFLVVVEILQVTSQFLTCHFSPSCSSRLSASSSQITGWRWTSYNSSIGGSIQPRQHFSKQSPTLLLIQFRTLARSHRCMNLKCSLPRRMVWVIMHSSVWLVTMPSLQAAPDAGTIFLPPASGWLKWLIKVWSQNLFVF